MILVFLYILALLFIWITSGFWAFIAAVVGILAMTALFRQIGSLLGFVLTIVAAIFCIDGRWNNPVITTIAIAVAIILVAIEFKK